VNTQAVLPPVLTMDTRSDPVYRIRLMNRLLCLACLLLTTSLQTESPAQVTAPPPAWGQSSAKKDTRTAGGAVSMEAFFKEGRVFYSLETEGGGELKITPYGNSVARVQWHWTHAYEKDDPALSATPADFPATPAIMGESDSHYRILTPDLKILVSKTSPLRVDFYNRKNGRPVCLDAYTQYSPSYDPRQDRTYDKVRIDGKLPRGFKVKNAKRTGDSSGFFGLGDWGGPINRRGHRIQMWNEDSWGWPALHSPKYTSFPVFYSVTPAPGKRPPTIYALFFNNPSRTVFDMAASRPDRVSFSAADGQIDYFFFLGGGLSFSDILENLTHLTGRPALLPKWALGYHTSKFSYFQKDIEKLHKDFSRISCPLSGVFIDVEYMNRGLPELGRWRIEQLSWNKKYFPSPKKMISSLLQGGIRTTAMVEPFLDKRDPLFKEAEQKGYFVRHIHGGTQMTEIWCTPSAGWIDFTNPEASRWWSDRLSSFCKEYGIRGVWNDLNETADTGQIRLDGIYDLSSRWSDRFDSRRWHINVKATHCIYSTKASYDALRQAFPDERPFVLSRGGFPGVQRWAAGWSGDNLSDQTHLSSNIRAGTSVGISGFSNYGSDVGGFSGHPSFPVLQRWYEWSSLSPFMRSHYSKFAPPREPPVYKPAESELLTRAVRSRYYFLPHIYSMAYASTKTGTPLNAPVVAFYPNDVATFSKSDYDFMVGSDMLVSPVVGLPEDLVQEVYLPGHRLSSWYSFWTNRRYPASRSYMVEAPMGRPPLFVRELGIIAVNPRSLAPEQKSPSPEDLEFAETEIHIWPGRGSNRYVFYDDDGLTPLESPCAQRLELEINVQSDGTASSLFATVLNGEIGHERKINIVFRALPRGKYRVLLDGVLVDFSEVDHPESSLNDLVIPAPRSAKGFFISLVKLP
jgi:alpha-glucosidase